MAQMKEVKIYAVVVTYNAMPWLERCMGSLRDSSTPVIPIVVDNGSTDDTAAFIRTHFPDVVLLPQSANLGFGQGNNVGLRYALQHEATHVLLLNQDAWISPNMLEMLLTLDDGRSLLSPIHLTGEGDAVDANFLRNAIQRSEEYERYQNAPQDTIARYSTYEINAACWLLPRVILEQVGGFSPLFFHYAEDTDYLQRLHYHGYKVYFVSGTYCYHDRAHVAPKLPTKQSIYQNLVLRAVDINYSPFRCWLHELRYGLAVRHTAYRERRWQDIRYYYQARMALCRKTSAIRANRRMIQTTGPHWLI